MKQKIPGLLREIYKIFSSRNMSLSTAESCTGGLVSHYVTSRPGASLFFRGGIIAYSEEIKKNVLGVSSETIAKFGVVSDETAREMAEKVRILTCSEYSLSVSGNLGPSVLEGKDKGLVYIAASKSGMVLSKELRLAGDREENKEEAAYQALSLLLEFLEGNE
jgi:nicotinamide-nucleotide amidase